MKTATTMKTARVIGRSPKDVDVKKSEPEVRVLKTSQAPSLRGGSRLTYQVGVTEAKGLCLRITANTRNGAFCQDWVDMHAVRAALEKAPKGETITSDFLIPLYRSRSANMPGFVLSVLLREGLVRRSEKEKRRYERAEPEAFEAFVTTLMDEKDAPASVDAKERKSKSKKAVPEKAPSASTKKKQ